MRKLWIYSLDPSLGGKLETVLINRAAVKVPWMDYPETDADQEQPAASLPGDAPDTERGILPGPVGRYLEVVDVDPASGCAYEPVDLDEPFIMAQGGLEPSDGNPQFHQQMVYAVAMLTIKNFERALGRASLWAPDGEAYVPRLRIYPHAVRQANAYYSPRRKALLFGYFPAAPADPSEHMPGAMVFTCLSHDIIAHETTHALLDGCHGQYIEPTNPDVLAFHEAFADIVAVFQHFTFREVVRHQIASTRGKLKLPNLLARMAEQFGNAKGRSGALRDYIRQEADPSLMERTREPHDRGALLVAAVFDAFLLIYGRRTADLVRIASEGRGILPKGALHPDLVNRLAGEASKAASHVLTICIRALDYLPPMDVTFGDYLRALITADYDLVPNDELGYRVAFAEAFRRRGIFPKDVRSLSMESLLWRNPRSSERLDGGGRLMEDMCQGISGWTPSGNRSWIFKQQAAWRGRVHELLEGYRQGDNSVLTELDLINEALPFEIPSIRPVRRMGPDGQLLTDILIELTQEMPGYLDEDFETAWEWAVKKKPKKKKPKGKEPDFTFRGGSTVLVDQRSGEIRHCVYRRIHDPRRYERQREFLGGDELDPGLRAIFFGESHRDPAAEVFALMHKTCHEPEEVR